MLSRETESIFSRLLLQLSQNEQACEVIREILADHIDFDPWAVFRYLDREQKGYIDEYNITDFLKKHSLNVSLSDVRQIISHFDTNGDGKLSYEEYLSLILTDSAPALRKLAIDRKTFGPRNPEFFIPYDVEYSIVKLFNRELELGINLQVFLRELSMRYDFNCYDLFRVLDTYGFGYLTYENFKNFLVRNSFSTKDSDVGYLQRRFDINRDGRITIRELKTILNNITGKSVISTTNPENRGNRAFSPYQIRARPFSPVDAIDRVRSPVSPGRKLLPVQQSRERLNSPVRANLVTVPNVYDYMNDTRRFSPKRFRAPENPVSPQLLSPNYYLRDKFEVKKRDLLSPLREARDNILKSPRYTLSNAREKLSPKKVERTSEEKLIEYKVKDFPRVRSPIRLSPQRYLSPSRLEYDRKEYNNIIANDNGYLSVEEETFINFIQDVMMLETEIEQIKCDLALMSDFNLEDAYRIFEFNKKSYLTDLDIKYGLNFLEVNHSLDEVMLLIKRFGTAKHLLHLSFDDFCEMIIPVDKEFYVMMKNRFPFQTKTDRYEFFYTETKNLFSKLMKLLLETEKKVEGYRLQLNTMPRFSIRNIFERIDLSRKNFLSKDDMAHYLYKNKINFLNKQIDLLWYRFDLNGDGKISYIEFTEGVYPKSKSSLKPYY